MSRKLSLFALAVIASTAGVASAEDKVDFEKQILPLFEERCMKCHRAPYADPKRPERTKNPKGDFRMDIPEGYAAGGEAQEEDGKKSVVPGKPDESYLVELLLLPEDDDDVMPPEGKADHFTDAEVALVKKWIADGATFGEWKGTKFDPEGNKVE